MSRIIRRTPTRPAALAVAAAAACAMALAVAAPASASATVWLCRPGLAANPCNPGLSTTVFSTSITQLAVTSPKPVKQPAIDCFYVYPTVSDQPTENANLHIDPVERSIALYQAARYSQYCRVFAPMYRQVTLTELDKTGTESAAAVAIGLADVRAAFKEYLAKYNHGRGFVLIGHSQGSFVLRELISKDVDPKPAVRSRLVSAILLGGNVLVTRGSGVGGDFKHVPACRSATQLGCVIAFSTFDAPVPAASLFGRPPSGMAATRSVLCTNPAALGGGSGLIDPIFPSAPFAPSVIGSVTGAVGIPRPKVSTVWISVPHAYRATCSSANGANVLEITPVGASPTPNAIPNASWGLHLVDANIALGNLVSIVSTEATAFAKRKG
jgi:hypothetical protein